MRVNVGHGKKHYSVLGSLRDSRAWQQSDFLGSGSLWHSLFWPAQSIYVGERADRTGREVAAQAHWRVLVLLSIDGAYRGRQEATLIFCSRTNQLA